MTSAISRSWPAPRLLGLPDRGHLGVGAIADIAVYEQQDDKAAMFGRAYRLFKDGVSVVEHGRVVRATVGRTHAVAPPFGLGIERDIAGYNRAQAAAFELAILVSGLHMLSARKIDDEIAHLQIAIDKTAGEQEAQAWQWLMQRVTAHRAKA